MMAAVALLGGRASAQDAAADSVDVLHYGLDIDMGHSVQKQLRGTAEITFVRTRPCNAVTFDLICDSLFPVSLDGVVTRGFSYDRDNALLTVRLSGEEAGDTHVVSVPYATNGYLEPYGWGGLHIDNNIYYNLGVAFRAYPHVYGRCWFPCRDNFYDKATYDIAITAKPGWRSLCSGVRLSETANADGSSRSVWHLGHPTPTYLVSISTADWHVIERDYAGEYGTYPALIGYTTHDSAQVYAAYDIVEEALPMFERAFGPYRWDRVGYISTPQGSMEHANNIGLVSSCMASMAQDCQMVICHELSHAWFGNLVTCADEGEMWFNEGGASFCEELATEAAFGCEAATQYYMDRLGRVIRSAHLDDAGWHALSGMSQYYTYGTTTYQKGALMWHSLRGLLGDSLFYSCMHRLFDNCAFGTIDAAGLRDSLSLYSGINLEGFFDFHVFHPGFVDYSIDRLEVAGYSTSITLRQLLRGTEHYARGNRVPVTFFSSDLRREKRWMLFDDSVHTETFELPFATCFAVVDFDRELSDACTDDTLALRVKGLRKLANSYCSINVPESPAEGGWVHVGHHFAHPAGDLPEGVVRVADRYWEVRGVLPWETEYTGRFLYNQGSNGASGAANLDLGFYDRPATLDSLCLLYRRDAGQPWQAVSRKRTSSSTISSGYFTARLLAGQYTLGVIDSSLVGIWQPQQPRCEEAKIAIYPNPSHDFFRIETGGCDKNFDVIIHDAAGRKILQMNDVRNGGIVQHPLPAGTYIVIIKNKFISLQSQIIVQ